MRDMMPIRKNPAHDIINPPGCVVLQQEKTLDKAIDEYKVKKPLVNIADAVLKGGRLYGFPSNHPDSQHVSNTKLVRTSTVIRQDDKYVETENTIYHIISWVTP
jgi:hypothetical protein